MARFRVIAAASVVLILLVGLAGYNSCSSAKHDPVATAKQFRDAVAAGDWLAVYHMADYSENEAIGWTPAGFQSAMQEATKGLSLHDCELKFLKQKMPSETAFGAYIEVPQAVSPKTKYIGVNMRLSEGGWKVRTYGLPSEACTLSNKDEMGVAGCLASSLRAAGLKRGLDPYAHVQRTVEDLDLVQAGKKTFDESLTLDLKR